MPKSDNRRKKAKLKALKKRASRDKSTDTIGDGPKIYQGMFEAPCGSMVAYFTPVELPSLEEYRRVAISDHIAEGECPDPETCVQMLATGEF